MALPRELVSQNIRCERRQDPTVLGRQLALRYRVSRNTVAEALRPPVRKGRKTLELETGTESYRLRATKAGHHGAR